MDELIIDERTKDSLLRLMAQLEECKARIHWACTTLLNYNHLEGEFTLLPDCTKLVRAQKPAAEENKTGNPEGEVKK